MRLLFLLAFCAAPAARAQGPLAPAAAADVPVLTLEGATAELLSGNEELRAARAAVDAARARYEGSFNVLLPRLSLDLNHGRSGATRASVVTNTDSNTLGVSGTLPLFAGGANRASVRRAGIQLEQARAEFALAQSRLVSDLRNAYAEALYAQESAVLSEEVSRRRAEFVELVRQKYEAGRESKAALLETQAQHVQARWERDRDARALVLAGRSLNRLLNRPLTGPVRVAPVAPLPVPGPEAEAFAGFVAVHPSLLAQESAVAAGRESLFAARAGYYPSLNLTSAVDKTGSTRWGLQDKGWRWNVGLSWPFFSGGRVRGETRSAQAELRRLEALKSDSVGGLLVEAEESLFAWKDAAGGLEVADAGLGAAEARAWLVQTQYSTGGATYYEWSGVQAGLISAQKAALAARRSVLTAFSRFEKALGRGSR